MTDVLGCAETRDSTRCLSKAIKQLFISIHIHIHTYSVRVEYIPYVEYVHRGIVILGSWRYAPGNISQFAWQKSSVCPEPALSLSDKAYSHLT